MIPKSLRICGHTYLVKYDDDGCRIGGCDGYVDDSTQIIGLSEGMPPDKEECTVLHEILHAVLIKTGVAQTLRKHIPDADEIICVGLAPALYDALKSNGLGFCEARKKK